MKSCILRFPILRTLKLVERAMAAEESLARVVQAVEESNVVHVAAMGIKLTIKLMSVNHAITVFLREK